MTNTLTKHLKLVTALSLTMLLAACGGGGGGGGNSAPTNSGSGNGGNTGGTTTTDYAPNSMPSGSSMSINPTLTLSTATTLTYANSGDSAFADSLASASWSYTPYTNGPTTGTLTIAGDGGTLSSKHFTGPTGRTAILLNFQFNNHAITGATATINGSTYAVTFSGSPISPGTGPATGGVTTTKKIETRFEGTWSLYFNQIATGSDFTAGEQVTFQVINDSITFKGKTLTGPTGATTNSADSTMSGPPWDFADAGTGVTYRFSPYSTNTTTINPCVTVIKAGTMLGVFTGTTPTTAPAGAPTPLLNKVHETVCTIQDDPNDSTPVGAVATFKFTDTNPASASVLLDGAQAYFQSFGGITSNADGSIWSSVATSNSGDVSKETTLTILVDTTKNQVTEISFVTKYSRYGALFRTATEKHKVTHAD